MSNDTAFPTDESNYEKIWSSPGMTLRDYFAAKAIGEIKPPVDYVGIDETRESYMLWASKAYRMADAMLAARAAISNALGEE